MFARKAIMSVLWALAIAALPAFPSAAMASDRVDVRMRGEPALPPAIETELRDIFADTLDQVLFAGESSEELRSSDPVQVADAIRTGINIVTEPRGYTVAQLSLDLAGSPVAASFLVHPVGWTENDPHAVTAVTVQLSPEGLAPFWQQTLGVRLAEHADALDSAYLHTLGGLPIQALDEEWALGLVVPHLKDSDPAASIFPNFEIEHSVTIGSTAIVTIALKPAKDLVELVRPRMFSRTLYNLVLDRLRERLFAEADFLVGMPKPEILAASDEIASRLASALERDSLATRLDAYATIEVSLDTDEPVVIITATVESRTFDTEIETFLDFGNENRDSSEIQGRFGFLIGGSFELFVNLNYFTNDSTLETDFGAGLLPTRDTFVAVAYDTEREAPKYFIDQVVAHAIRIRGEIFKDDTLNEFGLTYQFQQYMSAGIYTNGNNEYWVRAILKL